MNLTGFECHIRFNGADATRTEVTVIYRSNCGCRLIKNIRSILLTNLADKCFGRNAFQAFEMTMEMALIRKSNDLRYASNTQFTLA
jgi:hypothetical protein